jgi:hypothetical protein
MKKLIFAAVFTALTLPACAMPIRVLDPSQALKRQGDWIAVGGRAHVHQDAQFQFTDIDLVDPNGRILFIGYIPQLNEGNFLNLASYDGKLVTLNGVVEFYSSYPAMQILSADQLRLAG